MKVLVVSHNVFSQTESMGKTLSGYFAGFNSGELAQFYIHSQVPTSDLCQNYYRITDKEAITSIFGKKCGSAFHLEDIELDRSDSRTDRGLSAAIYQKARKRTPLTYIVRNIWWRLSRWNNASFKKWIDDFDPDCVFFASGDYAFMYEIARRIASSRHIPLYVSCMDDYYIFNGNNQSLLGRFQHRLFMRSVHKTMSFASAVFCICDTMSEDYAKLFGRKCITIHTPTVLQEAIAAQKKPCISYLGNLGLGRHKQLVAIGRALKEIQMEPDGIDVYSSESRPEILKDMTMENGIRFHGEISADEVLKVISESMAVIHTESFDSRFRQVVRYSVSTKIADSLASGTCIFAYGPQEIASISYLKNNNSAVCCTDEKELKDQLRTLIVSPELRKTTVENALALAQKNHASIRTPEIIRKEIGFEKS